MKKTMIAMAGLMALSLASCSGQPECNQDILTKKSKELTDVVTAAVAKDPGKGAALMIKLQEVMSKVSSTATANSPEMCKAVDDLIKAAKE